MRTWSVISLVVFTSGCFITRSGYRSAEELAGGSDVVDVPSPPEMDVPDLDIPNPGMMETGVDVPSRRDAIDVQLPAIVAPRLIAPLSNSRVTTRRFQVTLDAQIEYPARVEISSSRNFIGMPTRFNAAAGFARRSVEVMVPSSPEGIVFLRACAGLTECSPVWTLQMTRGDNDPPVAGVNKGWGVTGNVLGGPNANRTAEVVLSGRTDAWHLGIVHVYDLLNLSMNQAPTSVWSECVNLLNAGANCAGATDRGYLLSTEVTMLGDLNGDGRSEIGTFGTQGAMMVGGHIEVLSTQTQTVQHVGGVSGNMNRQMVRNMTALGDVNGDGLADVGIVAANAGNQAVDIYLAQQPLMVTGNPLSPLRRVTLTLTEGALSPAAASNFGDNITAAGDVNADGYADVAIGLPEQGINGEVWIYYGRPTVPAGGIVGPDVRIPGTGAFPSLGQSIAGGGDFDGDQYADLIVTYLDGPGRGYLYIKGGPMPSLRTDSALGRLDTLDTLAAAGDLNGDGRGDVIVTERRAGMDLRMGVLFVAPPNAMMMMPAHVGNRVLQTFGGQLGVRDVSIPGDVNGDGVDDVVFSTTNGFIRMLKFTEDIGELVDAIPGAFVRVPMPPPVDFGAQIAGVELRHWRVRPLNRWPVAWGHTLLMSQLN